MSQARRIVAGVVRRRRAPLRRTGGSGGVDGSTARRWVAWGSLAVSLWCAAPALAQRPSHPVPPRRIPASFRADHIYVRPVTTGGDTLTFYVDSGGGLNMLLQGVADRLELPSVQVQAEGQTLNLADWPAWRPDASIPPASDSAGPIAGRLAIVPLGRDLAGILDSTDAGFLGGRWLGHRVWTIDYPAGELWLRAPGDLPAHGPDQEVKLGFQVDSLGRRTTHFARLGVTIDGDSLELLFDTGATVTLTDSALRVLGDGGPARRAMSFMSATVFERWRAAHPDWRTIAHGSRFHTDLMEVPEIDIAGQRVGPVWFEERPTGTFEKYMSSMMDQPVVGALGGNALRFFRVTIDYPNAVAVFEREQQPSPRGAFDSTAAEDRLQAVWADSRAGTFRIHSARLGVIRP